MSCYITLHYITTGLVLQLAKGHTNFRDLETSIASDVPLTKIVVKMLLTYKSTNSFNLMALHSKYLYLESTNISHSQNLTDAYAGLSLVFSWASGSPAAYQ